MILGRVAGRITSTIHHPSVKGQRLLRVDRLDGSGYLIAMDSVGAGAGETVLVLDEGNGARQVLGDPAAPVRSIIVGIVDDYPEEAAR
ncbi:MAG: EutN/CcmL family microcompartment protein [Candidatus Krumholzibacteriia bacterium]|nr:EutN/CcmL family microcompartment protein [bacterium]MCB9515997.1 EutN/CcmL family microcompartment protein [Candidatus Latescibacterota bacterium]